MQAGRRGVQSARTAAIAPREDFGWTAERLAAAQIIWGKNCLSPRGDTQLYDIARTLTLRSHSRVMHIGAGLGGTADILHRGTGCEVIAADTQQYIAQASSGRVVHVQPQHNTLATSLDLVLVDNVAEHCHQLTTILENQSKGLLENGCLILRSLMFAAKDAARSEEYQAWAAFEPSDPCLRSEDTLVQMLREAGLRVRSSISLADDYAADIEQHWGDALDLIPTFHRDPAKRGLIPVLQAEGKRWLKRLELISEGTLDIRQLVAVPISQETTHRACPIPSA